jgi:hypothetical protein
MCKIVGADRWRERVGGVKNCKDCDGVLPRPAFIRKRAKEGAITRAAARTWRSLVSPRPARFPGGARYGSSDRTTGETTSASFR